MKKILKLIVPFIIIVTILTITSCSKEESQEAETKPLSPKEALMKNKKSLVNKEKIEEKLKEAGVNVPVGIEIEKSCKIEDLIASDNEITLKASSDSYDFAVVRMPIEEAEALSENECVIKLVRPKDFKNEIKNLQVDFLSDKLKKFSEGKIGKAIAAKDVTDRNTIKDMLNKKMKERENKGEKLDVLSAYQLYVTPEDSEVQQIIANLDDYQAIYNFALKEVAWRADSELMPIYKKEGGEPESEKEHWFYPEELLTITATLDPSNSVIQSDCSEQANFLVSALIAKGYDPENVRVVLAQVDFGDGNIGGHAFAQYFDEKNQVWVALDPTMGSYIEGGELQEGINTIEFDYFLTHDYDTIEMWVAYNNKYFLDFENPSSSNAPATWKNKNATLENVLNNELNS